MKWAGVLAMTTILAVGCAGESGEPIDGTVAIMVGDTTITPTVGAAIEFRSNSMLVDGALVRDHRVKTLVVIGTTDVSCSTNINSQLAQGTYLSFEVSRTPGMQSSFGSVIRLEMGSSHINSEMANVVIDSIDPRVTGSVTFITTDDMVGPISAAGTFDVIRCF